MNNYEGSDKMLDCIISPSITILGSSGGAAKAVLAILNQSVQDKNAPMHSIINQSQFHLIDMNQKDKAYYDQLCPHLSKQIKIHQLDLKKVSDFRKHLTKTNTKVVIDVSWADTIEMLNCCNELGILYVNSALENEEVDNNESMHGFPLAERNIKYQTRKTDFTHTTAITC